MRTTGPAPSPSDIEALQQIDLGERLKPASHPRDDHDLPRLTRLRERTDRLLGQSSRDDSSPRLTAASALMQEIASHFRSQRGYDDDVGLDKAGLQNFTQRRSEALFRIPGAGAIASQYGQSFAPDLGKEPPYPRLHIGNERDVTYHREVPGRSFHAALKRLYIREHGAAPEDYEVAFVNSGHLHNHLLAMLRRYPSTDAAPPSKELADGIIALHYAPGYARPVYDLIGLIGAHPSTYQVRRALFGNLPPIMMDENVDNRGIVDQLQPSRPQAPSRRLRLASPSEGTGAMAHTAADLIDDLCHVLSLSGRLENDQDGQNPLLEEGLNGLLDRLGDMNALHNDSARFGNAYRAMMEELHVVLATARPYTLDSFKQAALHHLESSSRMAAALSAKLKKPQTYLATSAMNALLQGLEVATIFTDDQNFMALATERHGKTPLYYEVEHLLNFLGQTQSPTSRRLIASLNFSYPQANGRHLEPWGVDAVIDATRNQVARYKPGEPPFILVLDTTVEHLTDLHRLTSALSDELVGGKLQIAVCKSFQKYSNLCSSKVVAGSITLLGVDSRLRQRADEHLDAVEQSTGWMANDEAQLMTHLLRSGHQEFRLLDRAVANAAFVRDTCFTGEGKHASFAGYHFHLPFGMVSMHSNADGFVQPVLKIRNATGEVTTKHYPPNANFDSHVLRNRDSFGFSETVQTEMPELKGYDGRSVRLSFGQESKAELTEMFYMPSRLMQPTGSQFGPQEARDHVNELAQAALTPAQLRATANKSLAHKLALIGANQAPRLSDGQRLAGSVTGMRRTLESQHSQKDFTLNKVASVVGHLGSLTLDQDLMHQLAGGADREIADQLIESLMDSNMPGVSRLGRETIAHFHAALCQADMLSDDPVRRQKGVQRLVDGLARMQVASTRGAYVGYVPDAVFEEQSVALRQRLLDLVFIPLSKKTRLELIDNHLQNHQLSFAESCLDRIERDDAGRSPGLPGFLESRRTTLMEARVQEQIRARAQSTVDPD